MGIYIDGYNKGYSEGFNQGYFNQIILIVGAICVGAAAMNYFQCGEQNTQITNVQINQNNLALAE